MMGPWWNPYRDGPDPEIVNQKRVILQFNMLKEISENMAQRFEKMSTETNRVAKTTWGLVDLMRRAVRQVEEDV